MVQTALKQAQFTIETYTGPASYIPGGFTVTTVVGPSVLSYAYVIQTTNGFDGFVKAITGNSMTIQVYTSGNTEVASGSNLTTVVFTVLEFGK
ncbi:MAG: hypothetical protein ACPLVI_07150 [Thermoplasmata archaeon]|jgi:hypothetical protein